MLYMEKYKKFIQKNRSKLSALKWNEKFGLFDEPYSVSDIQNYFDYIIKEHERMTDNPQVRVYDGA